MPYWAHNFREHQRWLVTSGRARVGVPVKRRRARSWCEPVAASVTGAHVSRMHLAVAHVTGYAFPSGHTTLATAAWGAIAFTAGASAGWRRRIALAAGAAMIAITVGVTRLYLGVHWLTEVIGGWTLGAAWLAITTITARKATAPQ